MRTLKDYIRGSVPIDLVEQEGQYRLVTAMKNNEHYFMKGDYVLETATDYNYSLYQIEIGLINHKNDPDLLEQRNKNNLYKRWLKFLKLQKTLE